MRLRLSRLGDAIERFLGQAGFDRGPWIVVAFIAGIASWFLLAGPAQWIAALLAILVVALLGQLAWRDKPERSLSLLSLKVATAMVAAGLLTIWSRSEMVGVPAIERPMLMNVEALVLSRVEQPAEGRIRLVLATREPASARAIKIRVNLPVEQDRVGLVEGALLRLSARLMPPAPPAFPGSYNFARAAWFEGLAASGSVVGPVEMLELGTDASGLDSAQRSLSAHVRAHVGGSPGAIAAAFASGDRGAIARTDEDAMRSAGLTHLLSISGLHVSAVIAAVYFLTIRLLALWPWLALRVRLPLFAAGAGALAGLAYTLLTGSEVPTVRSCVAALLVLLALALGREPLSLRMISVAAMLVLLLWPEALVSPGFQMSFASVLAIVALHSSKFARDFLVPREHEGASVRFGRRAVMLLLTGLVIELALMPIALFHFHRTGVYGALANMVAIPLVTFVTMPLIAIALVLDIAGQGAAAWWLVGKSLEALLSLAHMVAAQPGAVQSLPVMGRATFGLYLAGGLWLALWRGPVRFIGFVPIGVASVLVAATPMPDVLVTADGAQVGLVVGEGRLVILRESRSDYARDNLMESSGAEGEPIALASWSGARCSTDFCTVAMPQGGRNWILLLALNRTRIEERALAAACERADIVVAPRWLPASCKPRLLKADRGYLTRHGGTAISLRDGVVRTVAQGEGHHGWWRGDQNQW